MTVTVISYPLNAMDYSFEVESTLDSAELVKYLWVDVSEAVDEQYIEITCNGVVTTLLVTDECRYDPLDIAFQNKEGAIQIITFFKARRTTIKTESERFEAHRPIGMHQFVKYNVNTQKKFTANTGFIDETHNEAIQQLISSERVWLIDGEVKTPLNVVSESVELKTQQNDRLQINYAIEFEHAFYENNTTWV